MTDSLRHRAATLKFDLASEISGLDTAPPSRLHPRSKTVLKTEDFRLVLIALSGGARLKRHHADGSLSLHVLRGAVRVGLPQQQLELKSGELAILPPSLPHCGSDGRFDFITHNCLATKGEAEVNATFMRDSCAPTCRP